MKKILVIDDDPDILELVSDFLTSRKYAVITTTKGAQVLELAIKNEPDLIILDIILPDVDGLTVLKNLKTRPITAFIPVIMLTGQTASEIQVDGLISGADDYITKPFDLNVLYARILTALRRSLLFTRFKHDQFNLLNYLLGVYSKRGYTCYTKLLDGYQPHPVHWQGYVPDMIAEKPKKLRVFLYETTQSLLEETFIERMISLTECQKNATDFFWANIIVRTKDNYKLVQKLVEENGLDITVKYFKKHLQRK